MDIKNVIPCMDAFEEFCKTWGLQPEWLKSTDGLNVQITITAQGDIPASKMFSSERAKRISERRKAVGQQ
jgi:hypothetical protein